MSIDALQDKIRKLKNPSVVDLALPVCALPPHLLQEQGSPAKAYGRFCRELLEALKGTLPGARFGFTAFGVCGPEGLTELTALLRYAKSQGFYVLLEGPLVLSPMMAQATAEAVFSQQGMYPCDGLILDMYPGSDVIRPFLPYVTEGKKDLFPVVRTSNKSAPELQDLLSGSRLVHAVAADLVNRFDNIGKFGYSRVGALAGASSGDSLRTLRAKYPKLFLLVDDLDYSGCNAKNCSFAFDRFGHGAAVCSGPNLTLSWKDNGTDGRDYADQAVAAAQRMQKNLTRYLNIL